jgi:hypothetical protein
MSNANCRAAIIVSEFVVTLLVAGCALTEGERPLGVDSPPPHVRLGPRIEVLKFDYGSLRGMHAALGSDGRLHVLAALSGQKVVHDLVVNEDGSTESHVIGPVLFGFPFLDAALDSAGKLHALVDQEHWIWEHDGWHKSEATPWAAAGILYKEAGFTGPGFLLDPGAQFVAGAPSLTWCFQVEGDQVTAPGRWDWLGIGANGIGMIFPWHSHGVRTVLVTETSAGYGPWIVLEPKGDRDTTAWSVATDEKGNFSVLYVRSKFGIISRLVPELRYVRIPADVLRGQSGTASDAMPRNSSIHQLVPIEGGQEVEDFYAMPADAGLVQTGHPYYPMGVARDGETTLIFPSLIIRKGKIEGTIRHPRELRADGQYAFAPASGETFHVLGVQSASAMGHDRSVLYFQRSGRGWSTPIALDKFELPFPFPRILPWPAIAALSDGAAVAVWPAKDAIVAQWILRTE